MTDYLQTEIAMNSVQSWFTSLVIASAIILLAFVAKHIILRRVKSMLDEKQQALRIVHDVVGQTRWLFVFILALSLASGVLEMQPKIRTVINTVTVIALIIQMGLWASAAFRVSIDRYRERQRAENPASVTTINILNFVTRIHSFGGKTG